MYKKINITENHLQILSLFTNGFNNEYYIREIERILNISPRTSQLILEDLEKKTILESKLRGKIKNYKLKRNQIAKEYIIFAEEYKRISFLQKNDLIKEIITKIIPYIQGIGLIFGSYAKGIERKDSDLDIFIIGEYNKKEIKSISKNYGIEISIKNYPNKIFEDNINKDILIKEVIKDHVIIKNSEDFIGKVFTYG
jgi:uncharacterized protein